jgi:hypothetical protein
LVVAPQRTLSGLSVVLLCTALAGCGSGSVKRVVVTGKVVDGGKPLSLTGREYQEGAASAEVRFNPTDDALRDLVGKLPLTLSSRVNADGTFVMGGGDGKGIPVGKYKVSLTHRNAMPNRYDPRAKVSQGDLWGGRFSIDKTPFEFDIQEAKEVVLDVAQAPAAKP